MRKLYFSLSLIGCVLLFFPIMTSAGSLASITPTPVQDISDEIQKGDANGDIYGWVTEVDTEYEVVVNVDEDPAVVVNAGGNMSGWTNNGDGTVTINFTSTGLLDSNMEVADGNGVTMLVVEPPVAYGEGGPTVEATGMWLATNVSQWQLDPPMDDDVSFGWTLTGPEGESGFMKMFMADATVDFLGTIKGSPLTIDDLAVFQDDSQVTSSVTEVAGGLLVDIAVNFIEGNTTIAGNGSSDSVTKTIKVAEKLVLSSALKKSTVRKNKRVKLYGFHKASTKNKKIKIYKKTKTGNKWGKWVKIKTVRTNKNGYWTHKFTAKKKGTFKFRAKYKKKKSPVQTLTVRKAS